MGIGISSPFYALSWGGPFSAMPSSADLPPACNFYDLESSGFEYPFAAFGGMQGPFSRVPMRYFANRPSVSGATAAEILPPDGMQGRGVEVFLGRTAATGKPSSFVFPDKPGLLPYKDIILRGVRSVEDYHLAIRFLKELPQLVDDANREFAADIAIIATEFERVQGVKKINRYVKVTPEAICGDEQNDTGPRVKVLIRGAPAKGDKAVLPADDESLSSTSFCARTMEQMQMRRKMFASGIYLEHGALLSWVIHEIVHAMPVGKLPPRFQEVRDPLPEGTESVPVLYSSLIGRYICDEARAGLGEIFLKKAMDGAGVTGLFPKKLSYAAKGEEAYAKGGCMAYMDEGTYLGDNHFVLYQLRGLYQLAMIMHADPGRLRDFLVSDNAEYSGLWDKKNRVAVGEINFLSLYQRFRDWLSEEDSAPGNPLNPIRRRIREYLGEAAPVARARRTEMDIEVDLSFGDRPTPPPAGDPERIARDPRLTRDKVALVGTYADFLDNLYHLSYAEVRANMRSYMRFAERCHPGLAGIIYGRLP